MPSKRKPLKAKPNPAGYSNRGLADKLGLKPGTAKAILEAPDKFSSLIGTDEFDTSLDQDTYDFIHFFAIADIALRNSFPILAKRLKPNGMLWISWPKKSSGLQTDLDETKVREIGLNAGLVDVKICAIDATWSGLKFVYRLKDRP
jgi:hypothetical protein